MDQKQPRVPANAVCFVLLAMLMACRTEVATPVFDTRAPGSGYGDAAPALQMFLEKRQEVATGQPQHFCVVGTISEDGAKTAWVHWREGNMLILWEPGDEYQLARSRRKLDLATDVAATEGELNGSTYIVTRTWVNAITSACQRTGAHYLVEKTNNNG